MTGKVTLTIGKLAREAGVCVETIRYYQKRGLLNQPSKPKIGGFRSYTENDVERIHFIKRAQRMGFTLAEIAELIAHTDSKNCHAAKMLAEKKLKTIESQLVILEKVRETLKSLVVGCRWDCPRSCQVLRKFHGRPSLQE
ncbi:MAG TPA: MerR family transcriptional regulator [Sulfuricella sp.]|nr:MerR family transcriptional regulator [Sulfuricella sp.]